MQLTKTKVLDMTVYALTVDVGHQQVTNQKLHHVMLLDRSTSMTRDLDELVDNVIECLKLVKAEDLVTIIWYSGPGQWNILAKGSKVTDQLLKLVDSLRQPLGTTCFSEPLAQARLSAVDYEAVVDATWLTIFTDGQPVVPWSTHDEMNRAIREVSAGDFIACYSIGYGGHYNRDFLVDLARRTEHGEFFHAQNIRDYQILFAKGIQTVSDVSGKYMTISCDGSDILYLGADTVKLQAAINVHADRHFNTFYFIDPKSYPILDEKLIPLDTWKPMPPEEKENFLFAYAYALYRDGYRAKAIEVLGETRSRFFIEQAMNVFTNEEVGVFLQKLREAVFELMDTHQVRFPSGVIPQGMLPKRDAFCVLDLLSYLGQQENCYYVHSGKLKTEKYHRISKKRISTFNVFEFDKDDEGRASFDNLVYNENAANISIRVYRKGKVNLNPLQAKQVGLPSTIENCTRINNYNIIQDGKLNMKEMEVEVPYEVYKRLAFDDNIQGLIAKAEFLADNNRARMLLRLDVLPVINATYAQSPNLDFLAQTVYDLNILKARQKALKWVLDHPIVNEKGEEVTLSAYTTEQEQVLKEHGLSNKLVYSDIAPETVEEGDSYETRYMAFKLEKTTLPSIDDVMKKYAKSPGNNAYQEVIANTVFDFIGHINDGKLSEIGAKAAKLALDATKSTIQIWSHTLSTIRIAKVLTNDWFPGVSLTEKGGVYDSKYGKLTITSERKTIKL